MTTTTSKLSLREKVCYGFGDLASVLYWQTFMVYLLFFYTDVFGISAAVAGVIFLVSRIWDGVNDPLMGMIADRTRTRWGKFRPYLLWLSGPFAIVGVLTFTTPDFSSSGKIAWAAITFTLLMMLYTAVNIPYSALLGVLSPNPDDRTAASSFKFAFAYTAGAIVSFTLLPMAAKLGGGNDARGWQLSFVIYGVAAVAFFLIAFAFTRERVTPPKAQTSSMWKDLGTLGHNRPWIALVFATLVFILFVATRGSVSVHYFKYYVGEQQLTLFGSTYTLGYEWTTSIFNGIGQVAAILGALFTAWFAPRIGKKAAFMIYFTIAIVCTAALYPLRPEQLMTIYWLQIAGSFTGGSLSALIWAMYADAADFGEWKTGRRATGLVFSASTMSQKIGWAIGGFVAAFLLSAVGFEANKAASPQVQQGLRLMMSLIPAGFGVLAMGVMLLYRLNDKKMKSIEADLLLRRKESGEASA